MEDTIIILWGALIGACIKQSSGFVEHFCRNHSLSLRNVNFILGQLTDDQGGNFCSLYKEEIAAQLEASQAWMSVRLKLMICICAAVQKRNPSFHLPFDMKNGKGFLTQFNQCAVLIKDVATLSSSSFIKWIMKNRARLKGDFNDDYCSM